MGEIEVFSAKKLADIAAYSHPAALIPQTLTGLGKIFLGVAQWRAQNHLLQLQTEQLSKEYEFKHSWLLAATRLRAEEIRTERERIRVESEAVRRRDAIEALRMQAAQAEVERDHHRRLLLIEDTYRLGLGILRNAERKLDAQIRERRTLLEMHAEATKAMTSALAAMTAVATQQSRDVTETAIRHRTVVELANQLGSHTKSAVAMLESSLQSAGRQTQLALDGLRFEIEG